MIEKEPIKSRTLKVYRKSVKPYNLNSIRPEIRITGKWLENWGFKRGDLIVVRNVNNGVVLINKGVNSPPTIYL